MSLSADLREFIELLNSRGVEYVIVGAHSLAFHGRPRYTGDLDILVRPSPENAEKMTAVTELAEYAYKMRGIDVHASGPKGPVVSVQRGGR